MREVALEHSCTGFCVNINFSFLWDKCPRLQLLLHVDLISCLHASFFPPLLWLWWYVGMTSVPFLFPLLVFNMGRSELLLALT